MAQNDPTPTGTLLCAVHQALVAADHARDAVEAATRQAGCGHGVHRLAQNLGRRIGCHDLFGAEDAQLVRSAARWLDDLARDEIQVEYIVDECCVSGGYEQSVVTRLGAALNRAQEALLLLADALDDVRRHATADRIADDLMRRAVTPS